MYTSITFVALATLALARTDLTGCTSTDVSSPAGASLAYYVPGTGELCEFLDCGGGRAPPKTTVPGCPQYSGTLTYSPSFLPDYGSATAAPSVTSSASAESTIVESMSESSTSSETMSDSAISSASSSTSMSSSSSSGSTTSSSMSTITSVAVAPANGTITNPATSGRINGTVATTRGPSASSVTDSGAMETARVWASGAGLMGLGALMMAL
ncbi:hypothetical protein TI39_contig5827g00023 [Zymoseptoria brevis]|uniref:Uncharacterized protein n=1 Tax=Zymoseptoria brevis TaxID=1047168 RepID=A0A0F4G621_9PEZI|nr:hypothetical protein TI39_contig5827g00023 [Zymoseptoria brevis]